MDSEQGGVRVTRGKEAVYIHPENKGSVQGEYQQTTRLQAP